MGYVETVLQPDETVRFKTNYHWIGYGPGLALLVLAVLAYWWAERPNAWHGLSMIVALLLCGTAVILLVKAWFERWITEIAVTDRRIIFKTGFISRRTDEMPLSKVENIEIRQSILGRLLGYGSVDVQGTGSGGIGADKLRRIASPLSFRNHVMAG